MMRYSVQPRDQILVRTYWFLSIDENCWWSKINIIQYSNVISKNNKFGQNEPYKNRTKKTGLMYEEVN